MSNLLSRFTCPIVVLSTLLVCSTCAAREQWTPAEANRWYAQQPWLVGSNFNPSTAINQLEMWQADTFDLPTIDRELGWAESLGMNTIRVYLHDLLWQQDSAGFLQRMEQFLDVADHHGIRVMFVHFDSVWNPHPKLGKQPEPTPHVHNSGWVQSPGVKILKDPDRYDSLQAYVQGVIGHFRDDSRILCWDLFNEPDNTNNNSYGSEEPENKAQLALGLLKKSYRWARAANPSQPITSAAWIGDWADPVSQWMLEQSDIVTFHNYEDLASVKRRVAYLRKLGRPILCSEYMARPKGSTFQAILPYFKQEKIGAYNWGFVAGKSQTIYPWETWLKTYTAEPQVWFHDIFRTDGTPYDESEVKFIHELTGGL
jgi:hypothetical protein